MQRNASTLSILTGVRSYLRWACNGKPLAEVRWPYIRRYVFLDFAPRIFTQSLMEIIFATILERIFFNAVPTTLSVIGTLLILASAFYVAVRALRFWMPQVLTHVIYLYSSPKRKKPLRCQNPYIVGTYQLTLKWRKACFLIVSRSHGFQLINQIVIYGLRTMKG